jgi:hypothetical protein
MGTDQLVMPAQAGIQWLNFIGPAYLEILGRSVQINSSCRRRPASSG